MPNDHEPVRVLVDNIGNVEQLYDLILKLGSKLTHLVSLQDIELREIPSAT